MDTTHITLFLYSFITWIIVLAGGECDTNGAQRCLHSYQAQILQASDNLRGVQELCASDAVNQEAYACVNAALPENECPDTRANYHTQLDLIQQTYDQNCAALESISGGEAHCGVKFIGDCAAELLSAMGNEQQGLDQIYAMLIPPSNDPPYAGQQQQACNKISDIDFEGIKNCIITNGCANGSVMTPTGDVTDIPTITYIDVVDIIQGICKPGCEEFSTKYQMAKKCLSEDATATLDCRTMEESFICMRREIGSCATIRTFLEISLENDNIRQNLQQKCPALDLSLDPSLSTAGNTAHRLITSYLLHLLPIISLSLIL